MHIVGTGIARTIHDYNHRCISNRKMCIRDRDNPALEEGKEMPENEDDNTEYVENEDRE